MKKLFRFFAMTTVFFVLFGFSGCSVLSQTGDVNWNHKSAVVPFRAFSEGELSEAGVPEIDIFEGRANAVISSDGPQLFPQYLLEDAEVTGEGIPRPEEFFFWLLMIMAGYCLFKDISTMFEGKNTFISLLSLLVPLGTGIFAGIYTSTNMQFIIPAIGWLSLVVILIRLFRFHFLWFLIVGFVYALFFQVGLETGRHIIAVQIFFFLLGGVLLGFIRNAFLFVGHYANKHNIGAE